MNKRFSGKSILIYLIILFAYLIAIGCSMGIRSDHLLLLFFLSVLFFLTEGTHRFVIGIFPLVLSWWFLDALRVLPSNHFTEVHIKDLYEAEINLFGVFSNGKTISPNQYLQQFNIDYLHLITGFTYLLWIPIPFLLCTVLYFKSNKMLLTFTSCFLLTNIIGIVVYYLYPAAPPWYIEQYGFDFYLNTQGSAAGLNQFDRITGIPVFEGIYAKSFNVFGAVPSLHSAYPVLSFFYARKANLKLFSYALFIYMGLTWFTAVFTNHHYVIDVLAGIVCAIVAIIIMEKIVLKSRFKHRLKLA